MGLLEVELGKLCEPYRVQSGSVNTISLKDNKQKFVVGFQPRLLTLCLSSGFLFMQFLISQLAFMTTVLSFDPPKSPLKRGTLKNFPVPPFLRGARGDRTRLLHE